MKIFMADDHIPDETVHDDQIAQFVAQRFHSSDSRLIDRFVFMRKMVNRLRDAGFDVSICNRASLVEKSIRKDKYSAAVIDLGWYADDEVPENIRPTRGYAILEILRKKHPLLPVIMYSERLLNDETIPQAAAQNGALPVFKDFTDTCIVNLIAVLHFVDNTREQVRRIDASTYTALAGITKILLAVALAFITLGLTLLLFTRTDAARLTGGLSLITSAMSGVFWKYLSMIRERALSQA